MCDGVLHYFVFTFFWCPCMAISVSVQHNGGLLPDIILLTQGYYRRGTRLNAMKRFYICSLWSHLNVLTFLPPPNWGMLRRSRYVLIFNLACNERSAGHILVTRQSCPVPHSNILYTKYMYYTFIHVRLRKNPRRFQTPEKQLEIAAKIVETVNSCLTRCL